MPIGAKGLSLRYWHLLGLNPLRTVLCETWRTR
ncbi:TPA_asm: hypothetical protein [Porphyromonas phage phage006a_EM3]|uniref:Uncharacterized protein n=1 Tax=Porphyromonas phage phage006a_EM3 TaxID=3154098 RepID=A0AAT9J800_9CAUD